MNLPGEIGIGTVIADTYEVTRLIGQGGMGAVFEAQHRRLPGKRVAVKVLLNASKDPESLARFRREAEIASRLGHPNIIEVIDFHALPSGTPYMILELLSGESLAARLRRQRPTLAQTVDVVRQVGSALYAAHREQIVHRDLKPDNIFLCPTDSGGVVAERVKVLDFGISKIRGSNTVQTQESALLGTPQYMSPEQAFGRNKTIDQRTDVWALGTIVYEMLAGRPAFSGDTLAQVILSIVNEPAPSLAGVPGVPEAVVKALDRALAKEPDQRWPDVASFVGALTGTPLQTLDRMPVAGQPVNAFASTAAEVPTPASLNTMPRGESQSVPPTHQVSGRGGRPGVWIGASLGVIGAGVAVAVLLLRRPEPNVKLPGGEASGASRGASREAVPSGMPAKIESGQVFAAAQPTPPSAAVAAPPPVPVAAPPPVETAKPAPAKPAKEPRSDGPLPADVVADLAAAEAALGKGDAAQALHLARRTLTVKKSARAYSLITRAYCKQGDLGNARANLVHAGSEKAVVVRACQKLDVDLTP